MSKRLWPVLIALLAVGLIAAGCGDDDDEGSTDEPAATEEATDTGGTESDAAETEEASEGGSTPDDVLAACEDAIAGTPGEQAGQAGCEAAANAFETCLTESEDLPDEAAKETALAACQDAADQAVAALKAAG